MSAQSLEQYLSSGVVALSPIVDFNKSTDTLYTLDLTKNNTELTEELFSNTKAFSQWIEQTLLVTGSRYGIGGYNEHRTIYNRTQHFNIEEEPRTLHLGIDIWGPAGTPVYAPLHGLIHSFNYNDAFGDYGATIILEHHYPFKFFTLFGHLSLNSIKDIFRGQPIKSGEAFAEFGNYTENGNWPPHLHFQLILDMEGYEGDYPGVCGISKQEMYLANSPDPKIILCHTFE